MYEMKYRAAGVPMFTTGCVCRCSPWSLPQQERDERQQKHKIEEAINEKEDPARTKTEAEQMGVSEQKEK